MGHERVGHLPKSVKWTYLTETLGQGVQSREAVRDVASTTLKNVQSNFSRFSEDACIDDTFRFLVLLVKSSRSEDPTATLGLNLNIESIDGSSALGLTKTFVQWQESIGREVTEEGQLAWKALAETIAGHVKAAQMGTGSLFGDDDSWTAWRNADNAAGFCELSRAYFAKLTERYLRFYLDRVSSTQISNLEDLQTFNKNIELEVEKISKNAFETARITQSFAAGWYNNNVSEQSSAEVDSRGFLRIALQKIREELRREGGDL